MLTLEEVESQLAETFNVRERKLLHQLHTLLRIREADYRSMQAKDKVIDAAASREVENGTRLVAAEKEIERLEAGQLVGLWKVQISGSDYDWSYSETLCTVTNKAKAEEIVKFLEKKTKGRGYSVSMNKVETVSSFRAFKRHVWQGIKDQFS